MCVKGMRFLKKRVVFLMKTCSSVVQKFELFKKSVRENYLYRVL